MFLSSKKIICLAGIGMLAIGCSNQNPVTMDSVSSENSAAARSVTQTYMSGVPSGGVGQASMAASLQYPGNLEMVRSNANGQLEHLWWQPGLQSWISNGYIASNPNNYPALCVSNYDKLLQVVAFDASTSRLRHYYRDWWGGWHIGASEFGPYNCYGQPAFISNRHPQLIKNLEVVVWAGDHLVHIWRDENYVWRNETHFAYAPRVFGYPKMVQTNNYDLHVIAPILVGSANKIGHWKRANDMQWVYLGCVGASIWGGSDPALAINYSNNTLEAFIPEYGPSGTPCLNIWRYNGSQWIYDGVVQEPNWYHPCATTRNNNEIHVAMNYYGYNSTHWKIMQQ